MFADEQVARIELKLLFSVISSENMARNHSASQLLKVIYLPSSSKNGKINIKSGS